jgi:hypothetical protein
MNEDDDEHLAPDSPRWRAGAERGSRRLRLEVLRLFAEAGKHRGGN